MNNSFKEKYWMEKYQKEQEKREKILTIIVGSICAVVFMATFHFMNNYTKDSIKKCTETHSYAECIAHA